MQRADYWDTFGRQDQSLAQTIASVRTGLAAATLPAWGQGDLLGVIAMGASTMAAEFLVHEARARQRVVLNWAASDWRELAWSPASLVIGISESGRSPETIEALARTEGRRMVITNAAGSPVTEVADTVLTLGGVADAGVYISGYTSTLAALALIGEALGLDGLADGIDEAPELLRDWMPAVIDLIDEFLARHYADVLPASVDCVGAGASFASANETALLMREAGRIPSGCFQTDQYLHGPAEAVPNDFCAVVFGDGRADELVAAMVDADFPVLHVSTTPVPGAAGVRLPAQSALVTSLLEVVVGQVLAGRLGDRSGHEIGTFRHEFAGTKLPVIG